MLIAVLPKTSTFAPAKLPPTKRPGRSPRKRITEADLVREKRGENNLLNDAAPRKTGRKALDPRSMLARRWILLKGLAVMRQSRLDFS